jgi:hypothetical protein
MRSPFGASKHFAEPLREDPTRPPRCPIDRPVRIKLVPSWIAQAFRLQTDPWAARYGSFNDSGESRDKTDALARGERRDGDAKLLVG